MLQTDPRGEYERRLTARTAEVERLNKWEALFGNARVASFVLTLVLGYFGMEPARISPWWCVVALAVFAVMVSRHRRVVRQMQRARKAAGYYRQGLARLEDKWPGTGTTGERYREGPHLYAADLDLFGPSSLYQRLCTTQTRMGDDTLAAWLLSPASPDVIRRRHAAIDELRDEIDLREELALLDRRELAGVDPAQLRAWAARPALLSDRTTPILAVVFAVLMVVALVGWDLWSLGAVPFLIALVLHLGLMWSVRASMQQVSEKLEEATHELELLAQVLAIIENRTFQSPALVAVTEALGSDGLPPSAQVGKLIAQARNLESAQRNQIFGLIAFVLLLFVHFAYAIECWRKRIGAKLPEWLEAVGTFEALVSISGYAYEHPGDPFAELAEEGPLVEAEQIGHPLLPQSACVRNDLKLDGHPQLLLVSGSNMSGKSTLLRAVGTNVVLALAGAPVRAKRLRISPLQVASSMRIQDSLLEGRSHFFAEIERIRDIMEMGKGPLPLLFLLDELLHGTNSHDRRVGAEGVLKSLLEQGALGMVTTHDLALSEVVASLGDRAANVHLEDQMVDGKMTFDYVLRPGVVPKSNALALMRLLGLDV